MSTDKMTYSRLSTVARGYADSILAHCGLSSFEDEWDGITSRDFSTTALAILSEDCKKFLDEAEKLNPGGKRGLRDAIDQHDLGWHFFLARQGTGVGYENFSMGSFGDRLTELAESYDWIEVEISDKGKIHFLV